MNAQTKIEKSTAIETIQYFALDQLYLSDLNPRPTVTDEEICLLAESIKAAGLLQNLSGLKDKNGKVGIVAGGRRLRALKLAIKDRPELSSVPVQIAPNKQIAELWANTENAARKDLDAVDEIRAYGKLTNQNMDVSDIAKCFGVTEKHVYRRLALANLPAPVLDALQAKQISLSDAQAMTLSKDKQKTLEALKLTIDQNWSDYQIKRFLTDNAASSTDSRARYIGIDAYKAAGGTVTQDLFAESVTFDDGELLQKLFLEQLTVDAEELRSGFGWAWVEINEANHLWAHGLEEQFGYAQMRKERGKRTEKQAQRYDELRNKSHQDELLPKDEAEFEKLQCVLNGKYLDDQKQFAGLVVYVQQDGTIDAVDGLVRPDDKAQAQEAGHLPKDFKAATVKKSAFSQAFVEDMTAIRLGALQSKLLENPELVLDLLAFSLSGECGYSAPIGLRLETHKNKPSVDDGFAIPKTIDDDIIEPADRSGAEKVLALNFKKLRKRGKAKRDQLIVETFARSMQTVGKADFFQSLMDETKSNMRDVWTPSGPNCFKRMKGAQLDDIFRDMHGIENDSDELRAFAKNKKGRKVEILHRLFNDKKHQKALKLSTEQLGRINSWVPDC